MKSKLGAFFTACLSLGGRQTPDGGCEPASVVDQRRSACLSLGGRHTPDGACEPASVLDQRRSYSPLSMSSQNDPASESPLQQHSATVAPPRNAPIKLPGWESSRNDRVDNVLRGLPEGLNDHTIRTIMKAHDGKTWDSKAVVAEHTSKAWKAEEPWLEKPLTDSLDKSSVDINTILYHRRVPFREEEIVPSWTYEKDLRTLRPAIRPRSALQAHALDMLQHMIRYDLGSRRLVLDYAFLVAVDQANAMCKEERDKERDEYKPGMMIWFNHLAGYQWALLRAASDIGRLWIEQAKPTYPWYMAHCRYKGAYSNDFGHMDPVAQKSREKRVQKLCDQYNEKVSQELPKYKEGCMSKAATKPFLSFPITESMHPPHTFLQLARRPIRTGMEYSWLSDPFPYWYGKDVGHADHEDSWDLSHAWRHDRKVASPSPLNRAATPDF